MNDLSTSLTHFISLLLVVDLTETWFLEDMVETVFKDFWSCPGVTKRSVKCQVSKILIKLFGENVKGQGRGRKRFYKVKFNLDLTRSATIFPAKTDKTASYNEVLGFVDRFPSGSKVCFYRSLSSYIHTGMLLKIKCCRKLLLELNVEPSINNQQEEAFVEINEVNDVLRGIQEKSLLTTNVSS